jgi:Zn-dependent peptidase ImmA (M78 family)/DNA-binding XRE family transcriptional regulator
VQQSEHDLFGIPTPPINKDRIKQARELAGLTQEKLAELVGVKQAWIAKVENGRKAPSSELMASIAHHTSMPLAFFAQESILELGEGTLLFRAKASITRRQEIEAKRHAEIVLEFALRLASKFNILPVILEPLKEKPTEAARIVRKKLGFDDVSPVPHLIRAIEKAGAFVLGVPRLEDRYAFANWAGKDQSIPLIAVADGTSADRLRFSVAHELGHLILHNRCFVIEDKRIENEAHEFAAEFLAPEKGIKRELMAEKVTLERLGELKVSWGISIQALLRRAFDLSVVTERQYRYMLQQIGMRGWRMEEPVQYEIPLEKPRLIRQMAEALYGEPLNYALIASDAHLTIERVQAVLERYANSSETQAASDMTAKIVRFPHLVSRQA